MILERIKSLIYCLACVSVVIFCLWGAKYGFDDLRDLSLNGRQGIAEIVDYEYKERRGRKGRLRIEHNHLISYDSYQKWVDLDKEYPFGTRFYVLYSSENTENLSITKNKLTFYELYKQKIGLLGTAMFFGIVFYFIYLSFGHIKQVFETEERIKERLPNRIKINKKEMMDIHYRLKKPLKISVSVSLLTFCALLYIGFDKSEFPSLVIGSVIISTILFSLVYLLAYRGPKNA